MKSVQRISLAFEFSVMHTELCFAYRIASVGPPLPAIASVGPSLPAIASVGPPIQAIKDQHFYGMGGPTQITIPYAARKI